MCAGEEGALRLTDGGGGDSSTPGVGVAEIFHAGAWGTICEGGFELAEDDYGPPLTEVRPGQAPALVSLFGHPLASTARPPATTGLW